MTGWRRVLAFGAKPRPPPAESDKASTIKGQNVTSLKPRQVLQNLKRRSGQFFLGSDLKEEDEETKLLNT